MKKSLILYWHGLGDVIMLTPALRELYSQGYKTTLLCRQSVETSMLFKDCHYIDELIIVENPHQATNMSESSRINIDLFRSMSKKYKWSGMSTHNGLINDKVDHTLKELRLGNKNPYLEVFIPKDIEEEAMKYINQNYPDGYIFNHTTVEFHPAHTWDSTDWIDSNLPNLPIIDTGKGGNHYMKFDNINFSFVLAREAKYRVLSSSVFVHACEAMGVDMEVINYGKLDRKVWPKNQKLVKRIRENEKWVKQYGK
jgi:hypothetical protein